MYCHSDGCTGWRRTISGGRGDDHIQHMFENKPITHMRIRSGDHESGGLLLSS